jgi:hypothetical protein
MPARPVGTADAAVRSVTLPIEERTTAAEEAGGSTFELAGALTAIALAAAGLAGMAPFRLAAFGTIAAGFALLAHGGTLATRWAQAVHIPERARTETIGLATEVVGGFVAIVLGVLAASDIRPLELLPVATIALATRPGGGRAARMDRDPRCDPCVQRRHGDGRRSGRGARCARPRGRTAPDLDPARRAATGIALAIAAVALTARIARRFA